MKKFLLIGFLFLAACAPPSNDSDATSNKIYAERKAEYESISGLYEGTLVTDRGQSIPIAINIGYDLVSGGKTADGKESTLPELRVGYDQSNFSSCTPVQFSKMEYTRSTGLFTLGGKAPTGEYFNIESNLTTGFPRAITGTLTSQFWYNGTVSLKYKRAGGLDPSEILDRRVKFFNNFTGDYELLIKNSRAQVEIDVSFYIKKTPSATGVCASLGALVSTPNLTGQVDAAANIQTFGDYAIVTVDSTPPNPSDSKNKPAFNFHLDGQFDPIKGTWNGSGNLVDLSGNFTGKRR